MNLARLCTEIQRNAELSINKIVEDYLTKQNKHKTGNKNKTSNKKVMNYKPRFTPREHKLTSPIHTLPPTDTTTAKQNTQSRFKQHTSTTTTGHTQPTDKSHAFTCAKPQLPPQYTTAFHCQPNTYHTLKHTHTHHQLTIIHPSADQLHPQPILQPIYNTIYHSNQLIKPTQILRT